MLARYPSLIIVIGCLRCNLIRSKKYRAGFASVCNKYSANKYINIPDELQNKKHLTMFRGKSYNV